MRRSDSTLEQEDFSTRALFAGLQKAWISRPDRLVARCFVAVALVTGLLPGRFGNAAENAAPNSSARFAQSTASAQVSTNGTFGLPRVLLTNSPMASPLAVAVADFDSDGAPDLALATGNELRVFCGQGRGTFVPTLAPIPAVRALDVICGDFNGDGQQDLVLNVYTNLVVLLAYGNGCFQEPIPGDVGATYSFASGDFNGDGKLDLVIAQTDPEQLLIALGRGDGTFQAPSAIAQAAWPGLLAVTDFNGDGKLDVALAAGSSVSILLGKGDGSFQAALTTDLGMQPGSFAAGDFNHDGKADLVIGKAGAGDLSILLGVGDGTFRSGDKLVVSGPIILIVAADLNGDGRTDLLVTTDVPQLNILLSAGDGSFADPAVYEIGAGLWSIAIGDFNRDAKLDLAVAEAYSHSVSVLLGNGVGQFPANPSYDAGPDPYAIVAADFNNDGQVDLAVANMHGPLLSTNSTVVVRLGKSDGSFGAPLQFPTGPLASAITAADVNGDGKLDLITANLGNEFVSGHHVSPGTVSVLLGNGDGTFRGPQDNWGGMQPVAVLAVDFNADGKPDLAVGAAGDPAGAFEGAVNILLSQGDGTFQAPRGFSAGRHLVSLAVADCNRDGKLDLVAGTQSGTVLLLGNGDGNFNAGPQPTTLPGRATVGDINGDGIPDLAISSDGISIFLGIGDGTFKPGAAWGSSDFNWSVALADLDRDGEQDLVLFEDGIGVMTGTGDGDFKPVMKFDGQTRFTAACFALADFNHDGKPDVIVANERHLTLLLNQATAPELTLAFHQSGGVPRLSWSSHFPGAVLESASTWAPERWEAATETAVLHNSHWESVLEPTKESRFYRLRQH